MYDELQKLGIPVTLTRTTDETLSPSERTTRVKNAYGNTPDVLVISNHINAAGTEQTGAEGAEVIYALRNNDTLAKNILENIGEAGQVTRKYYQRRLPSNPSKDYYFMLRDTANTTPVIVEYGFIDNANDIARVNQNYKKYVDAVIKGIAETYGLGGSTNTYTVKNGDSLWKIANQFGVTVNQLKSANNLTSDVLRVGQVLTIPSGNSNPVTPGGNTYTVKNGDSLWKIANQFGITINQLKSANNLTSDNLQIGQVLTIPSSNSNPVTPGGNIYTVKSGDSLWSIARKYDTTVDILKNLNNLSSNTLSIGQVLNVPSSTLGENIYTVKSGDSLWKIANEYNTTVARLKELNNLSSNNLSVGQTLIIP